jgi:hypothetical protein
VDTQATPHEVVLGGVNRVLSGGGFFLCVRVVLQATSRLARSKQALWHIQKSTEDTRKECLPTRKAARF